jgi:SnoaL-like polyketide cyclase
MSATSPRGQVRKRSLYGQRSSWRRCGPAPNHADKANGGLRSNATSLTTTSTPAPPGRPAVRLTSFRSLRRAYRQQLGGAPCQSRRHPRPCSRTRRPCCPRRLRRLLHRRRDLHHDRRWSEDTGPRARPGLHYLAAHPSLDAHPKVKTLVAGEQQAASEADFVGTHIGEFLGMPASGKSVNLPYCVVYDLRDDKIAALRIYMPMELFSQQLG